MSNKITFLAKILIIILSITLSSYALELKIVPLKKPLLNEEVKKSKILKNIIKPKEKPQKKIIATEETLDEKKMSKKELKPKKKPQKKIITTKKIKGIIIPKSKPLVVKTKITKAQKKSKFYRKKDFNLARKAIISMEKKKWVRALSTAKKARDKSIYKFIQWQHLLAMGNQASFYDYQLFINNNKNYPRIGRLKYLAEHKLSTKKISPKKNNKMV